MAGLIAGRDSAAPRGNEADQKWFAGMAPDARIVNVKAGRVGGYLEARRPYLPDYKARKEAGHDPETLKQVLLALQRL